ncbi:hypothetical protein FO519_003039 [Halicephalobus sp. NKZ332]|nr:hypothetical protein FO519_003039 [Halicephalobus sp. NKZ332]
MKPRYLEPPVLTFDPGTEDEESSIDRWSSRGSMGLLPGSSQGLLHRALSPSFNRLLSPFRKASKLLNEEDFPDYGALRKNSFWDRLTPDSSGFAFRKNMGRNVPRRVVDLSDHKTCALLMEKMKVNTRNSPQ